MAPLIFLPPASNTPWSGPPPTASAIQLRRGAGREVDIGLPLFWYDPPWCDVVIERADILAAAVAASGVLVSALHSDLASPERSGRFHSGELVTAAVSSDATTVEKSIEPSVPPPRMVPYRPERYGFQARDFDGATLVDVRLTMTRDALGRFAYSPKQIQRWEATPSSEPLAGGGWVPAATFPPDVVSLQHLENKLEQLRLLATDAAVFISVFPYRLDVELPPILAAHPDGLIVRFDDAQLTPIQLASFTQRTRQRMDQLGAESVPLWIVPGEISADDAVKLMVLGASAVAIDAWCDPLIPEAEQLQQTAAQRLGYNAPGHRDEDFLFQLAQFQLSTRIDRFVGLTHSLSQVATEDRLASYDATWAETLGVLALH